MATQVVSQKEQDVLKMLRSIPLGPVIDEMNKMGYHWMLMEGVRSRTPGRRLAGRAVTLRYLPPRPDVHQEVRYGTKDSPEYRAYELCGPGTVLVIDAYGRIDERGIVGGDVKFHRLKRRGCEGLVTDGSVRDINEMRPYGFAIFTQQTSLAAGPTIPFAYGVNEVVQCGGVLVRPGDYIVGEDDGVVVIPASIIEKVVEEASEHDRLEKLLKAMMDQGDFSPGQYYPLSEDNRRRLKEAAAKKGMKA
ncbi:MAG: hypothetical protein FJ320_07495 [SAR202 cluster bacterium]|nr:hypothetical protein [SAR202 cluster bacterium]